MARTVASRVKSVDLGTGQGGTAQRALALSNGVILGYRPQVIPTHPCAKHHLPQAVCASVSSQEGTVTLPGKGPQKGKSM